LAATYCSVMRVVVAITYAPLAGHLAGVFRASS
jgi:hypothetical protein